MEENISQAAISGVSPRVLRLLLQDKATGKNIVWATDNYISRGEEYAASCEILPELITGPNAHIVQPRVHKSREDQSDRTRKRGEVYTPFFICKKMCGHAHEELSKMGDWKKYVDARVLEITAGEAPFLVSPYDAATGEPIPLEQRVGLLDRKLQAVNDNAQSEEEWLQWALRAVQGTYGYEYQGDSLLLARLNVLTTYGDYLRQRWKREPTTKELEKVSNIIAWNLFQMDGLKHATPIGSLEDSIFHQFTLFDEEDTGPQDGASFCRVYDWRKQRSFTYEEFAGRRKQPMKFDFVIGNPPYQEEVEGTSDRPIYNEFMDAAYAVSDRVELITPARFLFNAGKTPKAWNQKMLNDPHIKVLWYRSTSASVFPGTDIKGGVAVTYRDEMNLSGAIKIFTPHEELNSILKKVLTLEFSAFNSLIFAPESYRISKKLHQDHPNAVAQLSDGHMYDFTTNIFDRLPQVFFAEPPIDEHEYVGLMGRENNRRIIKWIRRDYVEPHENLDCFKVIIPKANGSGMLGEELSTPVIGQPVIGQPVIGHNQTFISIGAFKTQFEAEACLKYVKSKFARTMLGTLKVTQDNKKSAWANVPLQDFTPASDIDWSKSIPEIDQQLYKKYGLSQEEINFIESHVKEME